MFDEFEKVRKMVDEVEIDAVVAGSGPPVLMLHGFPQTKAMWSRVAPQLTSKHTVVCADLRGYGDSGKPDPTPDCDNYSFRQMALDNIRLMEHLGFGKFHIVGHDRGGRVAHRMALDYPNRLMSMSVLDIVPTPSMFLDVNRHVAKAYWHWYFLSQPHPFPERMIESNTDQFYENCLVGWGATDLESFPSDHLAEYRRCWRTPDAIRGSCADYRSAALIDIEHHIADENPHIDLPSMIYYGEDGTMAQCFDIPAEWQRYCKSLTVKTSPGGHFFVDIYSEQVAETLSTFFDQTLSLD